MLFFILRPIGPHFLELRTTRIILAYGQFIDSLDMTANTSLFVVAPLPAKRTIYYILYWILNNIRYICHLFMQCLYTRHTSVCTHHHHPVPNLSLKLNLSETSGPAVPRSNNNIFICICNWLNSLKT